MISRMTHKPGGHHRQQNTTRPETAGQSTPCSIVRAPTFSVICPCRAAPMIMFSMARAFSGFTSAMRDTATKKCTRLGLAQMMDGRVRYGASAFGQAHDKRLGALWQPESRRPVLMLCMPALLLVLKECAHAAKMYLRRSRASPVMMAASIVRLCSSAALHA